MDPVGQMVVLDNKEDYEVTGVYKDLPDNNHFHYNVMLTMLDREEAKGKMWMSFNFNTYLIFFVGRLSAVHHCIIVFFIFIIP